MSTLSDASHMEAAHHPMGFREFVLIVASIMALNPLAMDMMLPALPNIGAAFGISHANQVQAVLSVFITGFGLGQLFMGPLTDRYGRRKVLLAGIVTYCIASLLASFATSFETLLMARVLQGFSTASTRVIATSVVRDCYSGRRMASVMSLTMIVFMAVPVLAPAFGQMVLAFAQWRGIFITLSLCGVVMLVWCTLRLPETLPVNARRSIAIGSVLRAYKQTLCTRQTIGYALATGGTMGGLFGYIFNSQQVFTEVFHLGVYFPVAFAAIAIGIAFAGILNSQLVVRFGMRVMSHTALIAQAVISTIMLTAFAFDVLSLAPFMVLSMAQMFTFGVITSNFNALAMEPQGKIAGTASSMYGSLTTLIGVSVGYAISQSYDGTLKAQLLGFLLCTLTTIAIVLIVEKGRLFGHGAK